MTILTHFFIGIICFVLPPPAWLGQREHRITTSGHSLKPVQQGILFRHARELYFAVNRDGRRGHDAVFDGHFGVLGDIDFDPVDLWNFGLCLLDNACDQLLGRLALSSARS